MGNVPEGAILSEDGYWWWDESLQDWQPVEGGQQSTGEGEGDQSITVDLSDFPILNGLTGLQSEADAELFLSNMDIDVYALDELANADMLS